MLEGLVVKSTGKWVEIKAHDEKIYPARIRGKLKLLDISHTNPIAVGDTVKYSLSEQNELMIEEVLHRKNYVIRQATKLSKKTHIIAANIDVACLVISLQDPETPLGFIDRFLVTTHAFNVPTVLVLNKTDLHKNQPEIIEKAEELTRIYNAAGYEIIPASTKDHQGIDRLQGLLENKISLFSGQSGVGKSSLVNMLSPGLSLHTTEISKSNHKGQHTTTFAEMHPWSFGGYLIDTPGIKEFGLVDISTEELQDYFPEIFKHKKDCKFHNCLHIEEPSCAVKKAVEDKLISIHRYQNYLHLMAECEH